MPLALLIIGTMIAVAALRGTERQLGALIVGDFSGGFLVWVAAIIAVGALGYIPKFEYPARMLLALVLIAILLANGGFFAAFKQGIANPSVVNAPSQPGPPAPLTVELTAAQGSKPLTVQLQGGGGKGGGASGIAGAASSAAGLLSI